MFFCYAVDVGSIPIMHSKVQIFSAPTWNDFSSGAVKKCSVQRIAELHKEKVSFCFSSNFIFETCYTSLPFIHDLCDSCQWMMYLSSLTKLDGQSSTYPRIASIYVMLYTIHLVGWFWEDACSSCFIIFTSLSTKIIAFTMPSLANSMYSCLCLLFIQNILPILIG